MATMRSCSFAGDVQYMGHQVQSAGPGAELAERSGSRDLQDVAVAPAAAPDDARRRRPETDVVVVVVVVDQDGAGRGRHRRRHQHRRRREFDRRRGAGGATDAASPPPPPATATVAHSPGTLPIRLNQQKFDNKLQLKINLNQHNFFLFVSS